jgi:hypothetical protein
MLQSGSKRGEKQTNIRPDIGGKGRVAILTLIFLHPLKK